MDVHDCEQEHQEVAVKHYALGLAVELVPDGLHVEGALCAVNVLQEAQILQHQNQIVVGQTLSAADQLIRQFAQHARCWGLGATALQLINLFDNEIEFLDESADY